MGVILGILIGVILLVMICSCLWVSGEQSRREEDED